MTENQTQSDVGLHAFSPAAFTPGPSVAVLDFLLSSVVEFIKLKKDDEPASLLSDLQTVLIPKIAQLIVMITSFSAYFNVSRLNSDKVLVVETVVARLSTLPVPVELKDKVIDIVLAAIFTSFIAIKPEND